MTSNKSSFSGMTKITYALGLVFILVFIHGRSYHKTIFCFNDLENVAEEIVIDESIEEQIPEVPNQ